MTSPKGKNASSKIDGIKVLIIGTGEFGTAVAQSCMLITNVNIVHVSARAFILNQTVNEMAAVIANSRYIMYCGSCLTQHSERIADAIIEARVVSAKESHIEFIDWSNPDPGVDYNEDIQGAVALARFLEASDSDSGTELQLWKVWKATGVSNLDVAGHEGKMKVAIYGGSTSTTSGSEVPSINIPGISWSPPHESSLLDEAYDRLICRAEVDRWYDATLLSFAIFVFAFTYAYTRYSEFVNGKYPNTMVPMYIADKGISWVSLWMMVVCPFAGNILTMGAAIQDNWSATTAMDRILIALFSVMTLVPLTLFFIPWSLWCAFRHLFFMGHRYNTKSIYERQDDTPGTSIIKASLIDMVSMKHETGVVGFFWAFTHCMLGFMITDSAYKTKWFQENGRAYGNIEISMTLGVVGFTLITVTTIRSLFGTDYWMKLKPIYAFVSPLGIIMSALHVVLMGYKGWYKLFDTQYHNGHPSITFMSSMYPLVVLVVNLCLNMYGTKKRCGGQKIWKHSATNAAHARFNKLTARYYGIGGDSSNIEYSHRKRASMDHSSRSDTGSFYF